MQHFLYNAAQSQQLDVTARHNVPLDGYGLMCRAGRDAFDVLCQRWPSARRLLVLCGGGNNGGDGWVVARLAHLAGMEVTVCSTVSTDNLRDEAARAYGDAVASGIKVNAGVQLLADAFDVVVDALLGTGFKGDVRDNVAEWIGWVNDSGLPVVSLDLPSGVVAAANAPLEMAISADVTVAFIGWNVAHWTGPGRALCGERILRDLGVGRATYAKCEHTAELAGLDNIARLPRRGAAAHKGHFGHVVAVGGELGMGGAIALASRAAQRSGAGLVSVFTRPEHVAGLNAAAPEVMAYGSNTASDIGALLASGRTLLMGPGLGKRPWGQALLQCGLQHQLPSVIDADALNLVAGLGVEILRSLPACVISPHPGEASRLLGVSVADVEADRLGAARLLQQRSGAVVILKGVGTIVDDGVRVSVCAHGNPGMASGGMGDVLSGIIAALMAQGMPAKDAARTAVVLHSAAADKLAIEEGECGLAASDLIPVVRKLLNE